MENEPILVNGSPIPDMAFALGRDIIKILIAFGLGRGWIAGDVATVLLSIGAAVAVAWGQFKTFKRSAQLTSIANDPATPDHVAMVKGGSNA